LNSPCVVSYFAIKKPRVSVTSTCRSSGRRSGSSAGLPIRKVPAGHHASSIPRTVRLFPARIRNRALFAVLFRSGLRISEALALFPKDLDPAGGSLRVLHGKGDPRCPAMQPRRSTAG
jgi:integrase